MDRSNLLVKKSFLYHNITPDKFSAFLFFPFQFDNDKQDMAKNLTELYTGAGTFREDAYRIKNGLQWNENMYFYPYVREILFHSTKKDQSLKKQPSHFLTWNKKRRKKTFLRVVHRAEKKNTKNNKNTKKTLLLKDVFLHLYDLGVGSLIFEIEDIDAKDTNLPFCLDFLNLARRIYPSFVSEDFEFNNKENRNILTLMECIEEGECPIKVEILGDRKDDVLISNSFSDFSRSDGRPYLSKIITDILDISGDKFDFKFENTENQKDIVSYRPLVDDRMFVHSYYSVSPKAKRANRIFIDQLKDAYNAEKDAFGRDKFPALEIYSQMIFLDAGSSTIQNEPMFNDLMKNSTYNRWANWGTYFGFSRYSSVIVSNYEPAPFIYNHHKTMYYQIAVLLSFYRGVLLSFSGRSAKIAKSLQDKSDIKEYKNGLLLLEELYKDFLLFRNRYWFKEVTAQEQGIEIFNLWNKQLNNPVLMNDVQSEIEGLYNFVNYQNEKQEQDLLNKITRWGGILLPLTIVTGFFGMNMFSENTEYWVWLKTLSERCFNVPELWLVSFPVFLLSFFLSWIIIRKTKKQKRR